MKKKPRRVVLGEGYPVYANVGYSIVTMDEVLRFVKADAISISDMGKDKMHKKALLRGHEKIRLVAEILDPHGKGE